MKVRTLERRRGWAFGLGVVIVKPSMFALTSRTWLGSEHVPATGGCVIAPNHISHIDPLVAAHFLYDHGRLPRYLAKSSLFKNKALGGFLRSAGQIPVERLSRNAVGAYDAAVQAVRDGECVVVYPEGTLTRDPDLWPMTGKTGAARIGLATGCPVIPVGQWGAHELLPPYASTPDLFPRKHLVVKAGPPVDLSDLLGEQANTDSARIATDRIIDEITTLVAELRQEEPPEQRYDPRATKVRAIGNPNEKKRRWRR